MRSKKAIINIITSICLQIVTFICALIVPNMIIKTFGSSVNGLILSITQFLGYITLLESGIGPVIKVALYRPIAEKKTNRIEDVLKASEQFFRKIVYIFAIYVIILCFVFPILLNDEFNRIYTISLVIIISITTFAEYFFGITYRIYLQAEQKTYVISIIQIITYILNTIIVVILINLQLNIQLVKLISTIIFVLRPILQNLYVKNKYNINLKNKNKKYDLKQKWDGLAQHVASVIHNKTDIIIITIFTNMKEVSVYSIYMLVIKGIRSLIVACTGGVDALFGDMIAKKEEQTLKKIFKIYELFYITIATICLTCTMLLIIPFLRVYTYNIHDINYVRPTFALIVIFAEFIWIIRQPYNEIIKAAGHFKQTKAGAWIEAILNITISLILVFKFGIIGVAIGTLISVIIRTIELVLYSSKYILKVDPKKSFIRIFISIAENIIIYIILNQFLNFIGIKYIEWIYYAIKILALVFLIILPINWLTNREDTDKLIKIIKKNFIERRKNNEHYNKENI